ncbi:MAG: SpoIIE family protein phosphatase [Gordonibacter sp.]|nr:SpoIIE family protein phosphatase [Gordonibacter sp.]
MKTMKLRVIFGVTIAALMTVMGFASFYVARSVVSHVMTENMRGMVKGELEYLALFEQQGRGDGQEVDGLQNVQLLLKNYTVGNDENSFVAFVEKGKVVAATDSQAQGMSFQDAYGIDVDIATVAQNGHSVQATATSGIDYALYVRSTDGIDIVVGLSMDYVLNAVPALRAVLMVSYAVIFIILFVALAILLDRKVVRAIHLTNVSLEKITAGNLEEEVRVDSSVEFSVLSEGINQTVSSLKEAVRRAEAAAWMERELSIASDIQLAAMPPDMSSVLQRNNNFTLYADIKAAKEVGGDFYDYFLIGEQYLGFVVADVSGKGIPAAMFMMTAKTHIKLYMEQGGDLSEAFDSINEKLCEHNDVEMFVTVFAGIVNLKTRELHYINAGHNPTALLRDGAIEWLRARSGPLVGMIESANYHEQKMSLTPGDLLFMYTDGVTEASNINRERYGTSRLAGVLKQTEGQSVQEVAASVYDEVVAFENGAPREDDITMLLLQWGRSEHER